MQLSKKILPTFIGKNKKVDVLIIFLLALFIRLLFLFYGAEVFYDGSIHLNGDSGSYSQSFINLYNTGQYTHDPNVPDASFGRLPGYPFFWGLHYMLFGVENVYFAVAVSQIVLDSVSAVLVFLIALFFVKNLTPAFISGTFYALYPFAIVWVPITGTETLASFLTLFLFYLFITKKHTTWHLILAGIILSLAFYTREYLGILLPLASLYFWRKYGFQSGLQKSLILGLVFLLFYTPWPARNYFNHQKIILLKPATAGYARYTEDVASFRSWLFAWHPSDWNPWFEEIVHGSEKVEFPSWVFSTEDQKQTVNQLVELCRTCGSGFHVWRTNKPLARDDCNEEIKIGFQGLKASFVKAQPFVYFFSAPMKNIMKSFFNLNVDSQKDKPKIVYLGFVALFVARGLLLILLLILGLTNFKQYPEAFLLLVFFIFMVIFISYYLRQVEMRYLLQAEISLIPFAGILFQKLHRKMNNNSKKY